MEVAVWLVVAVPEIDTCEIQLLREAWKGCRPVEISKVVMWGVVGRKTALHSLLHALDPRLSLLLQSFRSDPNQGLRYNSEDMLVRSQC